jgi:hypothetical protein
MDIWKRRPRFVKINADLLDKVDQIGSLYGLSKTELINMWLTTQVVNFYHEEEDVGFVANDDI